MSTKMQSLALPEVAIIRKGDAKIKGADGKETVGPDLKDRFRVHFLPGTTEYQTIFEAKYHTLKPERIRAMVLSRSVWESWTWANEAYTFGRMIAKADDTHYIMLRDPVTGEYKVRDGQPDMPYKPGDVIPYVGKDGKPRSLKPRTSGRLRLFIPEMERLVQFTLKTTSYYDRVNLDRQLGTLQMLADTLNGGNAAGIPFYVFRMEQEVCWNKPDGSAARVKKWLVNIEADSNWVRAATARLSDFALTGQIAAGLLEPPKEIAGPVEPEAEEADDEHDNELVEFFDAKSEDVPASDYTLELLKHLVEIKRAPSLKYAADALALSSLPVDVIPEVAGAWMIRFNGSLDNSATQDEAVEAADVAYADWMRKQHDAAGETTTK